VIFRGSILVIPFMAVAIRRSYHDGITLCKPTVAFLQIAVMGLCKNQK
jgi:hypothetical protein